MDIYINHWPTFRWLRTSYATYVTIWCLQINIRHNIWR